MKTADTMSTVEVGRHLGITTRAVYSLIEEGRLAFVKVEDPQPTTLSYRVTIASLAAYEETLAKG